MCVAPAHALEKNYAATVFIGESAGILEYCGIVPGGNVAAKRPHNALL